MNVLVVTAHHDDLELGCGGSVAKLRENRHQVYSLVMTHSGYSNPDNVLIRDKEIVLEEAKSASQILDYNLISFEEDTFDIPVNDNNVIRILNIIKDYAIDIVLTHWHDDAHPPHWKVNQMVSHASRHIPGLLGFAVNWYIGNHPFSPNFFIPITESHWNLKIKALKCYKSEFKRVGKKYVDFFDKQTQIYGVQIGSERAEGFFSYKYSWDIPTT